MPPTRALAAALRRAAAIDEHLILWNTGPNFSRRTFGSTAAQLLRASDKMAKSIPGGCYCTKVRYEVSLDNPDKEARTSICHCKNCKVSRELPIRKVFDVGERVY